MPCQSNFYHVTDISDDSLDSDVIEDNITIRKKRYRPLAEESDDDEASNKRIRKAAIAAENIVDTSETSFGSLLLHPRERPQL